jgi:hypothetical protein
MGSWWKLVKDCHDPQVQGIHCGLIMVIALVLFCVEPVSCKASVSITNGLTFHGIDETLEVHCHSADNDFGVQRLRGHLATYGFRFNPNVFGTTLFTCDFGAIRKLDTSLIVWEGNSYNNPHYHCYDCNWFVANSGFYVDGILVQPWPVAAKSTDLGEQQVSSPFFDPCKFV